MKRALLHLLAGLAAIAVAATASAVPITIDLVSVVAGGTGAAGAATTTLTSHTAGTGDFVISGGQIVSGSSSGVGFTLNILVAPAFDANVVTANQQLSSILSAAGDVTATGVTALTTCSGAAAGLVCPGITGDPPPGPYSLANDPFTWPETDDAFGLPETAVIQNFVGTDTDFSFEIVLFSDLDASPNGSVTTTSTYLVESVPEPGTLLMLGSGLAGLAVVGRRRH